MNCFMYIAIFRAEYQRPTDCILAYLIYSMRDLLRPIVIYFNVCLTWRVNHTSVSADFKFKLLAFILPKYK